MGWLDDAVDSVTDFVSDAFESVGSFIESGLEVGLNFVTGGLYNYAKDAVEDFIAGQVPEQEYRDRKRTVRSAAAPKQGIYGRVRTGGQLVYAATNGKDKTVYWAIYAIAGHEVEEIEGVYADDTLIASSNGPGVNGAMNQIVNSVTDDNVICWSVHGNRYSAFIPTFTTDYPDDAYDGSWQPPNWTTDHRLTYQAYVIVAAAFDKETFGDSGLPKFTFQVRGKNDLYDPRDGSIGYSDNHALVMLDVLRYRRGFNLSLSRMDLQSFSDAANISDEQVAGKNGTEKRYTVNGTWKFDITPLDLLGSVAKAGGAFPVYSQGQWYVVPGAYSAPVMSFDENDLIGGLSFQPGPGKQARHNVAKGTYVDPNQNYETVGFRELYVSEYVSEDGEVLEKDFQFPWTESGTMARRLAKLNIERNRYGTSVSATFKFRALRLNPGDRINLTVTNLGWTPRIFRVETIEANFESGVRLELREDAPEIYNWDENDALALDDPPAIDIPNGVEASEPAGLAITEELYRTLTRNAVKVRGTLSWNNQPSVAAYDIQYRKASDSAWTVGATFWNDNQITLDDLESGDHQFRVRSINQIGIRSNWAILSYTVVGKTESPDPITTLFVEGNTLTWDYPNQPLDLDGFLVRFHNGSRKFWADAAPAHEGVVTETVFPLEKFSGLRTFLVKAVDTTGNVSESPAFVVANLGDPVVENVVVNQNEAPAWDGGGAQPYQLLIEEGFSEYTLEVVESGTPYDLETVSNAGFTGAFINANDELEGQQIGSFYGPDPEAIFYDADGATLFYSATYERITYTYTFEVPQAEAGSQLTVDVQINSGFNWEIRYTPPSGPASDIPFPGSANAEAGIYEFVVIVPQTQSPSAPIITDIVTTLDVADISEQMGDVSISSSGTRLPITKSYRDITVVNVTLQDDGGTAETAKIIDKDPINGPLIECRNSAGTAVAGTIDAIVQGY